MPSILKVINSYDYTLKDDMQKDILVVNNLNHLQL